MMILEDAAIIKRPLTFGTHTLPLMILGLLEEHDPESFVIS
jgi:hypothetical protein